MDHPIDVPAHLRKYVVQQNYVQYTPQDQAIWRFVLLQTHRRHLRTAHAAYAAGFDAAGISVERIPLIAEMNERLAKTSFQAVCVDGFIPPRAFQAFQAHGLLPIAADIRASHHLTYTPAPDIIHEAAGHAPFLAQPDYAHYLRRIGGVGERAFSDAHDKAMYEAVFLLSELKEDPASTSEQLSAAEARLASVSAQAHEPSEAARVARLYWWTVEYGLVGAIDDYRLYGAGLLSSIGEGHFCHEPWVRKLPLDVDCVDFAYDITRPQPQLFVARDFEHLDRVLEGVSGTLAYKLGGATALTRALQSEEPACLELPHGIQLAGVVQSLHKRGDAIDWIVLSGECAIACDHRVVADCPRPNGYVLPLGPLADGETSLEAQLRASTTTQRVAWRMASGLTISGRLRDVQRRAERAVWLMLADCRIGFEGRTLLHEPALYPLLLVDEVLSAHAQLPADFHASSEYPATLVPKSRVFTPSQRALIDLYERTLDSLRTHFGAQIVRPFEAIHRSLCEQYPDEWLLRWNLLESLLKLGADGPLAQHLQRELEELEIRYAQREPIATGLAYLRELGLRPTADPKPGAQP
jgi:phenylalanine-4-hydroxylase